MQGKNKEKNVEKKNGNPGMSENDQSSNTNSQKGSISSRPEGTMLKTADLTWRGEKSNLSRERIWIALAKIVAVDAKKGTKRRRKDEKQRRERPVKNRKRKGNCSQEASGSHGEYQDPALNTRLHSKKKEPEKEMGGGKENHYKKTRGICEKKKGGGKVPDRETEINWGGNTCSILDREPIGN